VDLTVAVVGPTATGKSRLAVALARQLGGEIVNADAMSLYRGMDIGTAKPTAAERDGIPHHLFDLWDVREPASVAAYAAVARPLVAEIRARGQVPILVGGSGLYVRAVVDSLDFPGTDEAVRARLEQRLAERGPAALHAELAQVDPAAAARILPGNGRRIVRALEVVELTGRPFSAALPGYADVAAVQVGVDLPADELDRRIAGRVDQMWAAGLVAEVRALVDAGLRTGRTASRALGYRQVLDLLDGRRTAADARADTVQATRRFARRQRSWFRRDPRVRWFDATDPALAGLVLAELRAGTSPTPRPDGLPSDGPAGSCPAGPRPADCRRTRAEDR
jgi:tRNA dimethylallyltransferase